VLLNMTHAFSLLVFPVDGSKFMNNLCFELLSSLNVAISLGKTGEVKELIHLPFYALQSSQAASRVDITKAHWYR
jgi:hypothetical protein